MFYGQMMMQNYLADPSLSFCAVDDTGDRAPLQITDFGQGVQIDQLISKIYLESGGSGPEDRHEAYELSAYFYLRQSQLTNAEIPYFFITGDEHFYSRVRAKIVKDVMGMTMNEEKLTFFDKVKNFFGKSDDKYCSSIAIWRELKEKFNVFHLHKPYSGKIEKGELSDWVDALGEESILEMKTPKAVIDVILGAIALTSGARTMEGYIKDMEARGQSKERIEEVCYSLRHLTPKFLKDNVVRHKVVQEIKKDDKKEEIKEEKQSAIPEEEKKEEK